MANAPEIEKMALAIFDRARRDGFYQSAWARPEWFGIVAALLSLVLGYFFSTQFNAFFFFVTQCTSRRQFRTKAAA